MLAKRHLYASYVTYGHTINAHQEYTSPLQIKSSACRGPDATCGIAPSKLLEDLYTVAWRHPRRGQSTTNTHMTADLCKAFLLRIADHAHTRGSRAPKQASQSRCAPGRHPGAPCLPRLLGPRRLRAKLRTQPASALLQGPGRWGQSWGPAPRRPRPCSRPGGAQARVRPPHPQRVPMHGNVYIKNKHSAGRALQGGTE